MKFISDQQYNDLKGKADAYSAVVAAILENSEGLEAKDITSEHIIQALQSADGDAEKPDLQPQLDAANARVTELEGQLETSNARVTELEDEIDQLPAEKPASISSSAEKGGEKQDLVDYAKKNQDSPLAVIEQAKKEGFI